MNRRSIDRVAEGAGKYGIRVAQDALHMEPLSGITTYSFSAAAICGKKKAERYGLSFSSRRRCSFSTRSRMAASSFCMPALISGRATSAGSIVSLSRATISVFMERPLCRASAAILSRMPSGKRTVNLSPSREATGSCCGVSFFMQRRIQAEAVTRNGVTVPLFAQYLSH